jgi:hypothetical protein
MRPLHQGLVLLEHRDGAGVLAVVFEGGDQLAEHRRGVRHQLQRAGQRPDRQVRGPAFHARVAVLVERLRAWLVAGLRHRRGRLRQVIELGQPRGARHQPGNLAQRQRLAVRAQMPQQARDVARRQ